MTHISRKKLSSQTETEIIDALISVFTNLSLNDLKKVFFALITETERLMMAKRLLTIFLLSEAYSYEKIANSLNLTDQTISRIHFEANQSPSDYNFLLKKLNPWKRKRLLKEILKEVGEQGIKLVAKHGGGRIY